MTSTSADRLNGFSGRPAKWPLANDSRKNKRKASRSEMFKHITIALILAAVGATSLTEAAANHSETVRLKALLKPIDPCILDAIFSFIYQRSYPPVTSEALVATCKRHTEAFKCIKERSKSTGAFFKRGFGSFVASRQRANKKFCTNPNSEQAKRAVQDFKCIMEKRFSHYKTIDSEYANTLAEIQRRNYNDSALELKYFCCTTYKFRKDTIDGVGEECATAKQTMTDVISSVVPNDIALICDDEDKVAKSCAELEPIKVSKEFDLANNQSPALTGLYLVATLGEPE